MTSYERYMAVLRGEPCDILPRLPILMAFAAKYIGATYGEFAADYKVLVEANLRCVEDFGFDQVSAISDPYRETTGFGGEVEFIPHGVPRLLKPPLQDAKDLGILKQPDPLTSPRMRDRVEAVAQMSTQLKEQYSILGWVEGPAAEAADLRGVTNFLMDLYDDPAFCHELMALCVDVGIAFAKAQLEAGADTIGIGDAIVSQVSPDTYAQLIFPHEKRLVDGIHALGGLVRLHICGNITHLLPKIKELNVDILDLDSPVDLRAAREVVGPKQVIVTNLDPVREVKDGTREDIVRRVQELYQEVGNPLMVGAGCEVPVATPHENLKALCKPVAYRS
ncbi:MAG: uroporphyrinogen decarboxylase [Firmicutes bacterium]|nr:uroporphyrinogen decarboxylase [Bacillota bacterium]